MMRLIIRNNIPVSNLGKTDFINRKFRCRLGGARDCCQLPTTGERSPHISNARDCTYIPPVRLNHPRIVDTEARYYQAHPPQLSPPQLREVSRS